MLRSMSQRKKMRPTGTTLHANDSLPISERSSHFECLCFTKEQKDCRSAKMQDLCSEEMLAVIDSVLITMPKNVICSGGTTFSGLIGALI